MKRLEAFCWTDIALLKDKKLLVLICDTPEHAKQLLGRAHIRGYKFRYKSEADHFQITLFIHGLGNISIAIGPEHPAFPLAKTFETDFVNFTTGVQFPGTQLAYLKEKYTIKKGYTTYIDLPHYQRPYKPKPSLIQSISKWFLNWRGQNLIYLFILLNFLVSN